MTLERKAHQILVDALLDEAAAAREELYRRQAFGARRPALRELEQDFLTTLDCLRAVESRQLPAQ
jgi:hypothetical protein